MSGGVKGRAAPGDQSLTLVHVQRIACEPRAGPPRRSGRVFVLLLCLCCHPVLGPRSKSRQETDCCLGPWVEVKKSPAGGPGPGNAGSGNPQRSPSLAAWLAPLFSSSKREGDVTAARHSLHHSGGRDSNARRRSLNCGTWQRSTSYISKCPVARRPAPVNDGGAPAPNHADESCAPDQVEVEHLSHQRGQATAKARSAVGFTHARTPCDTSRHAGNACQISQHTPSAARQEHRWFQIFSQPMSRHHDAALTAAMLTS